LSMVLDEGPGGQTLRQILQRYDTEHGTTFLQQAHDLATRRLWTSADRIKAQIIDNAISPEYLRLGAIRQTSRLLSKPLVRNVGKVVPGAAFLGGATDSRPKDTGEIKPKTAPGSDDQQDPTFKQKHPSPESTFPDMTNAPPQENR